MLNRVLIWKNKKQHKHIETKPWSPLIWLVLIILMHTWLAVMALWLQTALLSFHFKLKDHLEHILAMKHTHSRTLPRCLIKQIKGTRDYIVWQTSSSNQSRLHNIPIDLIFKSDSKLININRMLSSKYI